MQAFTVKGRAARWAVVAVLTGCIAGCRKPQAPEYYGFQDLEVIQAGSQTTLATVVKLYNPNHFTVTLRHADVDVSINGKLAGHSVLDSTIVIPSRDTFFVPVAVQVNLKAILSNALKTLLTREVNIGLDGHVKISKGMLTFKRPFHYEGKQDINALLKSGIGF
jgi:LEA14-like dessication related protein